MIRVILVDDEMDALKNLKWELERFCGDVDVLELYTNPVEALSAINYLKPDCLFLDIEMPGMDGFGLLEKLDYTEFDLVITTAYDQYALQAFRKHAVGYLLKPVDTDELVACMERVRKNKASQSLGTELRQWLAKSAPVSEKRIALSLSGKTLYVPMESILYAKADGNYTELHFKSGRPEVVSKKLKVLESQLENGSFFRVHKSYLVNTQAIRAFVHTDGNHVILDNGVSVPVARGRKNELLEQLGR